jgi:hypothetical protein
MLKKIMPELPLTDVPAGIAHYRDVLGFKVNYQQHYIGVMDRDAVRLLLMRSPEQKQGAATHAHAPDRTATLLPVSRTWPGAVHQVIRGTLCAHVLSTRESAR